jgi:hypothetical protein
LSAANCRWPSIWAPVSIAVGPAQRRQQDGVRPTMAQIRKMKRSRTVALTTLTAAGTMTLTAAATIRWWRARCSPPCPNAFAAGHDRRASAIGGAYKPGAGRQPEHAPRFERPGSVRRASSAPAVPRRARRGATISGSHCRAASSSPMRSTTSTSTARRAQICADLLSSRANGNYYYGGSNYGPMSRTSSAATALHRDTLNRPVLAPARPEPRRHRLARRLRRAGEQPQRPGG